MGRSRLFIKPSAVKEIEAIGTKKARRQIVSCIRALADDPWPPECQTLSGSGKHRVRQGTYRILYVIEDDRLIVTVVRVGHRRDIYRR